MGGPASQAQSSEGSNLTTCPFVETGYHCLSQRAREDNEQGRERMNVSWVWGRYGVLQREAAYGHNCPHHHRVV